MVKQSFGLVVARYEECPTTETFSFGVLVVVTAIRCHSDLFLGLLID